MTYCVGIRVDAGLVFASDSRTNAGVDNVSTFCKMQVFENAGDRAIVMLTSGNLAVTQATLNYLQQAIRHGSLPNVYSVGSMYEVAELVGAALREVLQRDGGYLKQNNIDASVNFIVGGQIIGESMRLFLVYAEGNFIESTPRTSYFQIGETKYGKPIIDRVIGPQTRLDDAVKCVLVSFDSTMHSNLSVGMPIDLLTIQRDTQRIYYQRHIEDSDSYMRSLRTSWSEGVRNAFAQLPSPDWV